jgi:hypothetical protein
MSQQRITLHEIAQNVQFRTDLAEVLKNPILQMALDALERDNLPEFKIKAVEGMDPLVAIALDAAKRAGAQAVLARLRMLPYVSLRRLDQASELGQPWEYLKDEQAAAEKAAVAPGKRASRPKQP